MGAVGTPRSKDKVRHIVHAYKHIHCIFLTHEQRQRRTNTNTNTNTPPTYTIIREKQTQRQLYIGVRYRRHLDHVGQVAHESLVVEVAQRKFLGRHLGSVPPPVLPWYPEVRDRLTKTATTTQEYHTTRPERRKVRPQHKKGKLSRTSGRPRVERSTSRRADTKQRWTF